MNSNVWFNRQIEKYKDDPEFRAEELILEINEQICRLMEEQGISRSELARRMGVKRQFITKLLNGTANLTLLTLTKLALALDADLTFQLSRTAPQQLQDKEWKEVSLRLLTLQEEWNALPNAA